MKARIRLVGAITFVLCLSQVPHAGAAEHAPWKRRPGVVLYRLKSSVAPAQATAIGRVLSRAHVSAAASSTHRRSRQSVVLSLSGLDEEALADQLRATGAVEYAEPDYLMPAAATPNDPGYGTQWYLGKVNLPAAWDVTTGNLSVIVAVCDTGVDAGSADLAAHLHLPGYNVVDGNTDTAPVADHGTEVAGILGAIGNNGVGIAGAAWNVTILPVRITDNSDTTAWCSDMANGIEWAADHGAKIVNLSYETAGCPHTIEAASQYAQSRGALVVVAAGNESLLLTGSYPDSHTFLMVGATDSSDKAAPFSNRGTPVTMMAPGVSLYTTSPGGAFKTVNGTSFAAPLVSGAAALLFALSPSITPDQVAYFIEKYGKAVPGLDGYGRLDAGAAVAAAAQWIAAGSPALPPLPVPQTNLPVPVLRLPASMTLQEEIVAGYPNGYSIAHFEWSVQGVGTSGGSEGPAASAFFRTSWLTSDSSAKLSTQGLQPGYYRISVRALDSAGNGSPQAQAYVTLIEATPAASVRVFPNPWRGDTHRAAPITFDHLPAESTIKIFTVSGHEVKKPYQSERLCDLESR